MTSKKSGDLSVRARKAVAGFSSTRSKTPEVMFGGAGGPTHAVRAWGAWVETAGGTELLDWTMALGAVALGYADPRVAEAAARAAREGAVGPLPHRLEVEVAERLCGVYPGAQQARFFKTGAEAVHAAVRLARIVTGRERVVHVGYHGWLDGPTGGPGVPVAVSGLWTSAPFDDVPALEAAVAQGPAPAALLVEPVVERTPSGEWLAAVRDVASERGAVLVFDEIKTAFRLAAGGAAQRWGVHPDLAVLGKALANGFPLAAVVGPADLMGRVKDTWISSTLATEFVSLAAAGAVLDVWAESDVAAHLRRVGTRMRSELEECAAQGGWTVEGLPEMWFLRFADRARERRFLLGCASHGVLLKRGPYHFPSLAHDEAEVATTMRAVQATLEEG